jgi:NarL family two-component system response regulator LiaR
MADRTHRVEQHLRVIIADPDPLARRVVRDELQSHADFAVAAEAADGSDALDLCRHYRPELLICEAMLPRIDGIAVTRMLHQQAPEIRVVLFAVSDDADLEFKALRVGACGYLTKDLGIGAIPPALRAVARGEAAVSRLLTMRLIERLRSMPEAGNGMRPVKSNLTSREWEVLDQLVLGATTSTIASALFLTEDTVYSHVKNIMRKLGVRSRSDAVKAAERLVRLAGAA